MIKITKNRISFLKSKEKNTNRNSENNTNSQKSKNENMIYIIFKLQPIEQSQRIENLKRKFDDLTQKLNIYFCQTVEVIRNQNRNNNRFRKIKNQNRNRFFEQNSISNRNRNRNRNRKTIKTQYRERQAINNCYSNSFEDIKFVFKKKTNANRH